MNTSAEDMKDAILSLGNGAGRYACYKAAGPDWRPGYVVVTKADRRNARRCIKHVEREDEAQQMVAHFMR